MAEGEGGCSQNVTSDSIGEEDLDYKYKMDYPEKGVCVIINMEKFDPKLQLGDRAGTNKDVESLKETFESVGFQVMIENNVKAERIVHVLKEVAMDDHRQRSCFVCVVLSHGTEEGFYCFDDFINEEYLFGQFKGEKCKGLVGKPKLFFIQACRGTGFDIGVTPYSSSIPTPSAKIPVEADFLCHYSTPPGYVAWRNKTDGSWFIQSLCGLLKKYYKKYELMQILTRVNHKVAFEYGGNENKEMPCIVSKLTKDLYL